MSRGAQVGDAIGWRRLILVAGTGPGWGLLQVAEVCSPSCVVTTKGLPLGLQCPAAGVWGPAKVAVSLEQKVCIPKIS